MICNKDICCGCGACVSICPKNCIQLETDELGVIYPQINNNECINCGLCKKTCPKLNLNNLNTPLKCYASYLKDAKSRLDSASGGVAKTMYEKFLEKPNHYVVGVCWDENFNPKFKITNNKNDILAFQGSKYVQAFPENIYLQVEEKLKEGNNVLFIAMPCQVAAAKRYFEIKKINTEKLILVDILCHGVSPAQYLSEHLDYLKKKLKVKQINKVSFRSNRKFRNFHFCLDYYDEKNRLGKYNRYSYEDEYFNSFLDASSFRESCYTCNLSQLKRVSDVTIGDFIGLGKMPSSSKFDGVSNNASLILCNTQKGVILKELIENEFYISERLVQEAYEGGASLQSPYRKSKWRDAFIKNYKKGNFTLTIKKIGGYELRKIKFKNTLIRVIKKCYMDIVGMEY